ncbi:response regulator [Algoriphagus antarcticus]|uniref:Response regulator receiver domain-containing protein n=1 Tax=Algoriphagus antarcticus TaxID=238540 RepID=A0A3E0E3I0_9BACT|nr:response regulator [Algoriphagus antarcticus]REG92788.1 response regulator receiver domain-containing protein [Algoriphagus antarcticus]
MKRKLNSILLVDDDPDDNFYHQIVINKMNMVNQIDIAANGIEALAYLKKEECVAPDIIFLDLNMPKMNGWEFLEEYKHLGISVKAKVLIVILTTSANPDDIKRAKEIEDVTGFETKPLTKELLREILEQHFQDYL